jgi:hypothetical protein
MIWLATYAFALALALGAFHNVLPVLIWAIALGLASLVPSRRLVPRSSSRRLRFFGLAALAISFWPTYKFVERINRNEVLSILPQLRTAMSSNCRLWLASNSSYSSRRNFTRLGYRWVVLPNEDCSGVVVLYQFNGRKELYDLETGRLISETWE